MNRNLVLAASAALALGACMTRGEPEQHQERRGMTPGAAQMRYAPFVTSTYDAEAHTVDLTLATGVAVQRGWWTEELDMSLGAVDLTRKLMKCEHPGNCPHGRPTFIKVHQLKVEEWFNRKI